MLTARSQKSTALNRGAALAIVADSRPAVEDGGEQA